MKTTRRTLLGGMAAGGVLAPYLALGQAAAQIAGMSKEEAEALSYQAHMDLMAIPGLHMHGNETIVMIMYPGFTALDLVGPHYFFASMMGAQVHLVSLGDDLSPVASDLTLAIEPTTRLADAPMHADLVFLPGGTVGTTAAMQHEGLISYLRSVDTAYMTSVCTGSLILGAAGFLKGKRATGHWGIVDSLHHFGAQVEKARVVRDGPIITGAGVSAGLDFAIQVVEALRGRPYAQGLMLQAEYDPQPPMPGGSLDNTEPALAQAMSGMFASFQWDVERLSQDLGQAL